MPFLRNSPPAQGGIQILGRAEARGRLCDHAAQAPAVRRVRGGASASVLRQSGGAVASQRQVYSANCAEVRRDSSGAVLGLVGTPVVVQRQVLGFDSAENSGSTASAVL